MEASSPLGALAQPATRRLLVDLIATLNARFPDHDFSNLRPEQFCREAGAQFAVRACARHLAELATAERFRAPGGGEFLDELWAAIEEAIQLRECEVYSYVPDGESDPFSEGALWSFNYFFFNKRLKRIVYLSCVARSRQRRRQNVPAEATGSPPAARTRRAPALGSRKSYCREARAGAY